MTNMMTASLRVPSILPARPDDHLVVPPPVGRLALVPPDHPDSDHRDDDDDDDDDDNDDDDDLTLTCSSRY